MGPKSGGEAGHLPATGVSWYDAAEFCNRLSRHHGFRPCYRRFGFWRWSRWACDWRADGYRLPTEAEWEYACRAGSQARYGFGDDPARLPDFAWYEGNSRGRIRPVGTKRANRWGLFDMHGNVWEWCWDWYGPYGPASRVDPRGPTSGQRRVLRGGASGWPPVVLGAARRENAQPEGWAGSFGFRCVRVASPQR
jgi:formylglycine-generating enzyme required for sulfatase activity